MLESWIESGHLIDLVLILVAAEALALLWWRRAAKRRPHALPLLANLAAGAMLLLALRAALMDAGWISVAGWLSLGLVAHIADIGLRFRDR